MKKTIIFLLGILVLTGGIFLTFHLSKEKSQPVDVADGPVVKRIFNAQRNANLRKSGYFRYMTYQNGIAASAAKVDMNYEQEDIKELYMGDDDMMLVNYAHGYMVALPQTQMKMDFSMSGIWVTKAKSDSQSIVISGEYSPYEDIESFYAEYLHRYMLDPEYLETNSITLHQDEIKEVNGRQIYYVALTRNAENSEVQHFNTYFYAYIRRDATSRYYDRIMMKTDKFDAKSQSEFNDIAASYKKITPMGQVVNRLDFTPVEDPNWDEATKDFYHQLQNVDKPMLGAYTRGNIVYNRYNEIVDLEEKLDYKFSFGMDYVQFNMDFPVQAMNHLYINEGKYVELTWHFTDTFNASFTGKNVNFDIYDGKEDERIRNFARGAKEFGKPFLLRPNNEMNSDWVSYGGVATLNDPDIYIENWHRVRKIFEEEGVTNVIWIFNPNDRTYPPANYNSYLHYYPGNGYAQMLGVTGYNTGTYYADHFGEEWREFDAIYQHIEEEYKLEFGDFIWIITEFASSSSGGDKVKWIGDMFDNLQSYERIKVAIWFSANDPDVREGHEGEIARAYVLDETPETVQAFKDGLKRAGYQ